MSRYVSNITIEYYFTRYNLHTYARFVSPASYGSKFNAGSPKSSMYVFLASKRLSPISLKRRVILLHTCAPLNLAIKLLFIITFLV